MSNLPAHEIHKCIQQHFRCTVCNQRRAYLQNSQCHLPYDMHRMQNAVCGRNKIVNQPPDESAQIGLENTTLQKISSRWTLQSRWPHLRSHRTMCHRIGPNMVRSNQKKSGNLLDQTTEHAEAIWYKQRRLALNLMQSNIYSRPRIIIIDFFFMNISITKFVSN